MGAARGGEEASDGDETSGGARARLPPRYRAMLSVCLLVCSVLTSSMLCPCMPGTFLPRASRFSASLCCAAELHARTDAHPSQSGSQAQAAINPHRSSALRFFLRPAPIGRVVGLTLLIAKGALMMN